jgi:hypothetical protein
MRARGDLSLRQYLMSPVTEWAFAAMICSVMAYSLITGAATYPYAGTVVVILTMAAGAVLLRLSRWCVYGLLLIGVLLHIYAFTFVLANGRHDLESTRDEALESTSRALLRGENAWIVDPSLDSPATTGPTSVLVAIPFMIGFNSINGLSFAFWASFCLALLAGDVLHRNQTWPALAAILTFGAWGIDHTLYWSLDELYYAFTYLALAYLAARRGWWVAVGILLAASVLSRASYVFPVIGFGLWFATCHLATRRSAIQTSVGLMLGTAVILLPFVVIGGTAFWDRNPWVLALQFGDAPWPSTNALYRALNQLMADMGSPLHARALKSGLVLAVLGVVAWALRRHRIEHPFWHVTAGALLAHALVWVPVGISSDYVLMVLLPAMLGVAMNSRRADNPC